MSTAGDFEILGGTRPLRKSRDDSIRAHRIYAAALVAPLAIFVLVGFILPIVLILTRSIKDESVAQTFPNTATILITWNGVGRPPNAALAALVTDLRRAPDIGGVGLAADRLDLKISGFKGLLIRSEHQIEEGLANPMKLDGQWRDPAYWRAMRSALTPWTADYLLAALDLRESPDGHISSMPFDRAIYREAMLRTFWVSFLVAAIALVLGFPLALLLATVRQRVSNLLMVFVLVPFWTSLLVRTTAWVVLLQDRGVVNQLLEALGVTKHPIPLIFNRFGVVVAMVHVLLPFMVLPLYSVMKGIPSSYVRAAKSLGAPPVTTFWRVYMPQTLPGVAAGCLLVFIQAIGYYITPALVGGAGDQMISYFIAMDANQTLNWGMASALATILLALVLILYAVYARLAGIDKISMG